jgi:hypothetical protein
MRFSLSGNLSDSSHDGVVSALAVISAVVCAIGLLYALANWWRTPSAFKAVEPSDDLRKALDLRIDLASKLFDLSLIVLGIVWGFVLADKVTIDLSRWQHVVLFISTNLLLLISLFSHLIYRLHLANMMWSLAGPLAADSTGKANPKLPDITDDYVETPFNIQWILFFVSLVSVLCTIIVVKIFGG